MGTIKFKKFTRNKDNLKLEIEPENIVDGNIQVFYRIGSSPWQLFGVYEKGRKNIDFKILEDTKEKIEFYVGNAINDKWETTKLIKYEP